MEYYVVKCNAVVATRSKVTWENGRLGMTEIRRIYGGHMADIRRTHGGYMADGRRTHGEHTANIQRTYAERVLKMVADVQRTYGGHTPL